MPSTVAGFAVPLGGAVEHGDLAAGLVLLALLFKREARALALVLLVGASAWLHRLVLV